jgi:hypothetical protein
MIISRPLSNYFQFINVVLFSSSSWGWKIHFYLFSPPPPQKNMILFLYLYFFTSWCEPCHAKCGTLYAHVKRDENRNIIQIYCTKTAIKLLTYCFSLLPLWAGGKICKIIKNLQARSSLFHSLAARLLNFLFQIRDCCKQCHKFMSSAAFFLLNHAWNWFLFSKKIFIK